MRMCIYIYMCLLYIYIYISWLMSLWVGWQNHCSLDSSCLVTLIVSGSPRLPGRHGYQAASKCSIAFRQGLPAVCSMGFPSSKLAGEWAVTQTLIIPNKCSSPDMNQSTISFQCIYIYIYIQYIIIYHQFINIIYIYTIQIILYPHLFVMTCDPWSVTSSALTITKPPNF